MKRSALCIAVSVCLIAGTAVAAGGRTDTEIKDRVISAIESDPNVKLAGKDVNIQVQNGIVTFSGTVQRHETIDNMLSQALMVDGVKRVQSNVSIPGYNESARGRYDPYSSQKENEPQSAR